MRQPPLSRAIAVGAAAFALLAAGPVLAQDATPASVVDTAVPAHPTAIYEGGCGDLATEPSYELADAVYGPLLPDSLSGPDNATPTAGRMAVQDDVVPVAVSATAFDLNITELFVKDRTYAVGVSAPDSGDLVACGNLGGPLFQQAGGSRTTVDDARLVVGLREVNGSGYGGVAWVESTDGGAREGTTTAVTVFIVPPENA